MDANSLWGRAAGGQPTIVVGTPFPKVADLARLVPPQLSRGVEQVLRSLEQAEERLGRIHLPGER
jgi:hypothetical protein